MSTNYKNKYEKYNCYWIIKLISQNEINFLIATKY
jgi:hypothetical protein